MRGARFSSPEGRIPDATPLQGVPVLFGESGGRSVELAVSEVVDLVPVGADDLMPSADPPGVDPRLVRSAGRAGDGPAVLLGLAAIGPMPGEGA